MLIISRKKDQKIIVADDIEITILEVGRNRVRFGIKAPKDIPIHTRLKTSPAPDSKIEGVKTPEIVETPDEKVVKGLHAATSKIS
jgi:carbon storage regulator